MSKMRLKVVRGALMGALVLFLLPAAAGAVQHEVRIYLDLDDDTATGCEVPTVDGVFAGAEQVLITTVETSSPPDAGTITDAALAECIDEVTDTFGIPTSFDGNWPVGVGNGVGGRDVVETYAPLLSLVIQDPSIVHVGLVVTDEQGGEEALLTVDDTPEGAPILLDLQHLLEIPTLGEWGLILLALLLAASSVHLMGRRGTAAVGVVLLILATGVAWAAGSLDGLTDDWSAGDQLAANGLVLFGQELGSDLCFRVDLDLQFNQPPVAEPDAFTTDEDTVLNVASPGVLANDSDPDSDPLAVTAFDGTSAQGAAVNVNPDGSFSYDPTGVGALQALPAGDSVDDTFTYTIEDPSGGSDSATVTVTVDGVNDAPTAMDDTYETDEDVTLNVPAPGVLVNDDDVDTGDTLTAVLDTDVSNGSLTLNPDGSFTYDPDPDFNGTDSFTYHATDGTADSPIVTATITVAPVNDGPNAVDDLFGTDEDTVLNVLDPGVLTNDTDPEGDDLTVTAFDATSTEGATVNVDADGSFSYDPTGAPDLQALADGESVDDTFDYTVSDGNGGTDTATVTVTVDGVNDPPTATDDGGAGFTTDEDTPFTTASVLANDTDPDASDVLSVLSFDDSGTVGTVTDNPNGTFDYDPNGKFEGLGAGDVATDTFTYTVDDGNGGTDTATVTITINGVNDAPLAVGETFDVAAGNFDPAVGNTTLHFANAASLTHPHVFETGDVLDNDADPEGDPVTISAVDGDAGAVGSPKVLGSDAVVTLNADGEFTYSPPPGFEGTDTFTYTVSDGLAGSDATVTIEIAGMVWYLDEDASGGGNDGRSASPFESVAAFNDEQGGGMDSQPEAGDLIFLHDSADTYLGGIELLDQQKLLGEGVELLVAGQSLVAAGTRPELENTAGDAVTVLADAADRTGIEIRGLSIAGDDNAVEVTSANTFQVGVTISDNTIAGSGAEGLHFNPGSSGAFVTTVENNTFSTASAAGNAIDLTTAVASGDVEIALDANTNVTSSGGHGILLDNSAGGGNLFVTSFAGNTVHGNTIGDGIRILNATFDATPTTPAFTEVAGGNTTVGVGNPVGGSAMVLTSVAGDLAFGALNLSTDGTGSVGLDVTGNGTLVAGAGTGFEITNTGGAISSTNGPAVVLDPLTAGLTFSSVSSSNSSTVGVSLVDLAGTFSATGGSIATAGVGSGPTFQVSGGSVNASYGGSVASAVGNSVQVQNMTGGTVTLSGPVDDLGAGVSITGNDAATSVAFNGGLDLDTETDTAFTATGDGSVTVASLPTNTISTTTGTGVLVNGVDAGVEFDFDNVTVTNGGAAGISIQSSTGTKTFGLVNVTNSGGAGLFASNAGTVSVTNAASAIATTGQPAVDADNSSLGAIFASLTSTGSGTTGIDLASVGGSFTATSVTIDDTTGAGVQLTGNSAVVALNGGTIGETTSTAATTGGNAVDVDGGAATVTIAAAITNTAARSVEVTNRSGGTVTISGSISDTGTGINVANNTGGSTTFSNASKVLTTGTNPAVTLTANGSHSVDFTNGGLEITTTTGTGFQATGGGTVTVRGASNTIGATTPSRRTAVELDGVILGANDITFESLSVDAGPTGSDTPAIILANTTGGDFAVTGDGTTGFGGNGTGGTIENLTDTDAVTLNTTGGEVTLQNMIIEDIGDGGDAGDAIGTRSFRDAIHGENVNGGLVLQSVTIRRTSDHAILGALLSDVVGLTSWNGLELRDSLFESSNRFHVSGRGDDVDEGMIRIRGLTGTMVVDNCTLRDGARGLDITTPPGTGTLDATVQGSTFEDLYKEFDSGATVNVGLRGVSFEARGDHDMVVRIGDPAEASPALGNTFTNNMTASVVIFGQEGGSDPHTGTVAAVISQNTFVVTDHSTAQLTPPSFSNFNFPQGGVSLNPAGSGTFEAIVSNNLFDEVMHAAGGFGQLTIGHNTGGGASEFIVTGNEFRKPWDQPLALRAEGNGSMAILVENNAWTKGLVGGSGTNFEGGDCLTDDPLGFCPTPFAGVKVNVRNGGAMDLTFRNEDLPQHDDVNDGAFTFTAEVQAQAGNLLNLYLADNQASDGYRLSQSDGTFNLFRENVGDTDPTDILDGNGNTGGNGTVAGDPDTDGGNTDPPVVTATGTITPSDTAPTLPSIVIP